MAVNMAMEMMAQETIEVIDAVYGSFEDWLSAKIEATVRNEKGYDSLLP